MLRSDEPSTTVHSEFTHCFVCFTYALLFIVPAPPNNNNNKFNFESVEQKYEEGRGKRKRRYASTPNDDEHQQIEKATKKMQCNSVVEERVPLTFDNFGIAIFCSLTATFSSSVLADCKNVGALFNSIKVKKIKENFHQNFFSSIHSTKRDGETSELSIATRDPRRKSRMRHCSICGIPQSSPASRAPSAAQRLPSASSHSLLFLEGEKESEKNVTPSTNRCFRKLWPHFALCGVAKKLKPHDRIKVRWYDAQNAVCTWGHLFEKAL